MNYNDLEYCAGCRKIFELEDIEKGLCPDCSAIEYARLIEEDERAYNEAMEDYS